LAETEVIIKVYCEQNVSSQKTNRRRKEMKRNIFFLIVSLVGVLAFLSAIPFVGIASAQTEEETIKIGGHNPRSGPMAFWGLNTDRGVDLCVDEWNKKGGVTVKGKKYKLEIFHEDDKGKGEEAVKVVNKLVFTNKVRFIVGPMVSACVMAVAPMLEANKIVTVSNGFHIDILKNRKYGFRSLNTPAHSSPAFFKAVLKLRPDYKTSAHIAPNNATGWSNTQGDNDACVAIGIKVLATEFYEPGTQDFTSLLARILPKKPDLINLAGTPGGQSALVIKQARELGYKGGFAHAGHLTPEELIPIAGQENVEGLFTSSLSHEGPAVPPKLKKLYVDWIAKYGQENAAGFAEGGLLYDSVNVLCYGIEKANSLDPDLVSAAIKNLGQVDTLFGKGHWTGQKFYGNNHQLLSPHLISEIRGGKLSVIASEMPWDDPPPQNKWR
jgi:branched-chain amino acid transport system substrate-binding protein